MRVLVADDNRDVIMTLGILLRSEGHEVWSTQSGAEVPEAVRGFKPGVVLLDLGMPDRSGYDVAQELSREHGSDCPILIAVTGQSGPAAREKAEVSGFHHFITKPYSLLELLGLIDQMAQELADRLRSLEPQSARADL